MSGTTNQEKTSESRQSLWMLTIGPSLWAVHFLASYITAAIWCEKMASPGEPVTALLVLIGVYTLAALTGISVVGWVGYRRHSFGGAAAPHDDDTPEDRHRFLGYATLLLASMSAVAVIYAAFVLLFFGDCY